MNLCSLAVMSIVTLSVAASAQAQSREATLAAVMKLPSAERQSRLVDGAKKENGLVWYSSTTAEDALALTKKFHEQYPSIQIQHFRSSSEKLLERILAESRANAFKADIVSLPELELSIMIKRKLLVRYEGVENTFYPPEAKDPRGYWTGLYTSAWVPAHNTKMVPKDAAPKSYKDLLNPKWKGAIGMDNEPYNWYVITLRYLERRDGKEAALDYMKKLAAQQIQWRKGHSLIGQLMAAGEFPIAAELQVHTVERAKHRVRRWSGRSWMVSSRSQKLPPVSPARAPMYTRPRYSTIFYCHDRAWRRSAPAGGSRRDPMSPRPI